MKISFHLPDEWKKVIRQAMTDADSPSVVQFMKLLLQESDRIKQAMVKAEVSELPSLETSWGGPRKQVDQEAQESQVYQDDPLDLSDESPQDDDAPPLGMNPSEILAWRRAKASKKTFGTGPKK